MTVHDLNPIYHDAPDAAGRALDQLRRRLSRFDEVITLTRHVESDIRRHLGWQGPVQVIANGVRDLSQAPRSPVAALQGRPYFLHLSRMARSKNPHLLLDLAALWPDHALVMAGPDGSDSRALEARARERGLDNVIFLRDIDDATKAWLYANCKAFLFPSQTEGFGLPPLEAMCFGKPVFLSTLTSLPEIGGTAAAYWPELDAAAMAQVMREHMPILLANAHDTRQHAHQFSWSACGEAYLRLYSTRLGLPGLDTY
jgi:glycosyltransferase involved in cell wall biosynthesis